MMISDRERLVAMFERVRAEMEPVDLSWHRKVIPEGTHDGFLVQGEYAVAMFFFDASGRLLKVRVES